MYTPDFSHTLTEQRNSSFVATFALNLTIVSKHVLNVYKSFLFQFQSRQVDELLKFVLVETKAQTDFGIGCIGTNLGQ